jgi:hypothetical protein
MFSEPSYKKMSVVHRAEETTTKEKSSEVSQNPHRFVGRQQDNGAVPTGIYCSYRYAFLEESWTILSFGLTAFLAF